MVLLYARTYYVVDTVSDAIKSSWLKWEKQTKSKHKNMSKHCLSIYRDVMRHPLNANKVYDKLKRAVYVVLLRLFGFSVNHQLLCQHLVSGFSVNIWKSFRVKLFTWLLGKCTCVRNVARFIMNLALNKLLSRLCWHIEKYFHQSNSFFLSINTYWAMWPVLLNLLNK